MKRLFGGLRFPIAASILFLADRDRSGIGRKVLRRAYARLKLRRLKRRAGEAQVKTIEPHVFKKPGSKTVFVLGCGSSVTDLSSDNFDEIERGFSVGINGWVLHEFIPDVYAMEGARIKATSIAFSEALRKKESSPKRPKILLHENAIYSEFERIKVPQRAHDRVFAYTSIPFMTRSVERVVVGIEGYLSDVASGKIPAMLPLGQGASLERIVSLAINAGYKDIVLVGVDLRDSVYFWEADPSLVGSVNVDDLPSGAKGQVHKTADPKHKRFTILQTLEALARAAERERGVKVWCADPRSALAEFLEVYPWGTGSPPCLST